MKKFLIAFLILLVIGLAGIGGWACVRVRNLAAIDISDERAAREGNESA